MKQTGKRGVSDDGSPDVDRQLNAMISPLLGWYDANARSLPWRDNPSPYRVWISEIMLQQTRVEAVKPYFDRWMKTFPTVSALAAASEDEVLKLWEGLGYYSRARNIHKTAKLVMGKYGGSLPSSYKELRSLPGVGEYTAGSVGSIAFQLPVPCVDGNVLRVTARLTADAADIGSAATKRLLTERIRAVIPKERPGDFNQALMELGATVCLPNGLPKCGVCPVASLCAAHIQDRVAEFPVKSGKPQRKIERKTVLVLLDEKRTAAALRKRPESGLLGGLWEFPNFDGELSEDEIRQILDASCLKISSLVKLKRVKHIFTHIEWDMTGYLAVAEGGRSGKDFQWIDIKQMDEKLALPAAFKAYYQVLKRALHAMRDHETQ